MNKGLNNKNFHKNIVPLFFGLRKKNFMNDQTTFRALVVREENGGFQRAVEECRMKPKELRIREEMG